MTDLPGLENRETHGTQPGAKTAVSNMSTVGTSNNLLISPESAAPFCANLGRRSRF